MSYVAYSILIMGTWISHITFPTVPIQQTILYPSGYKEHLPHVEIFCVSSYFHPHGY